MTRSNYTPGGDAKIIAEIAKARFGGFVQMFEHHGWPERGSDMMRKVQTRVVRAGCGNLNNRDKWIFRAMAA